MKLKKGDTVLIIAGKNRGKTGTIDALLPQVNRVMIAGINMYKKHMKPSSKYPSGGIVEITRPVHASNVMLIDSDTKKATRIGYTGTGKNKSRIARLSGKTV